MQKYMSSPPPLLVDCFLAQLWPWAVSQKTGLVAAIVRLLGVNTHDLLAHVAGVDYKMGLVGLNSQFALVEVAAPVMHLAGGVLTLVALISFQIQMGRTLHRCETGSSIQGVQMLATHSIYAPRTASVI